MARIDSNENESWCDLIQQWCCKQINSRNVCVHGLSKKAQSEPSIKKGNILRASITCWRSDNLTRALTLGHDLEELSIYRGFIPSHFVSRVFLPIPRRSNFEFVLQPPPSGPWSLRRWQLSCHTLWLKRRKKGWMPRARLPAAPPCSPRGWGKQKRARKEKGLSPGIFLDHVFSNVVVAGVYLVG